MFLVLPDVRIYAIIILMARKEVNSVELEEAGSGILTSLQCSSKRLVVVGGERRIGIQTKSENFEKMTHDFRASLNIIIGFAELLLDEVPGKINAEQRRSLNDILNNSKRLLELAKDIVEQPEIESIKKQ